MQCLTKETPRSIRRAIYENFKNNGYHVRPEVKILAHHYTHLLFDMENGRRIAVEIETQHLSANKIDKLTDEYNKQDIAVKWIVVGNTNKQLRENQTFFLKRYQLNESKNKDLLVVSWDGTEVVQCKIDPNRYEYNGEVIRSKNYPEIYKEYAALDNLTFEDDELSFGGFRKRYEEWLIKKRTAFNKKVVQLKEENRKHLEEMHRQAQEQNRLYSEQQAWRKSLSQPIAPASTYALPVSLSSEKAYEQRKEEILPVIEQQQKPARDSTGRRWVKCEKCGKIDTDEKFVSYGGTNHVNLGLCSNCGGFRKPSK